MARKRDREINIFNIAFLDVITGAMGAFVLMVLLLAPYYTGSVETSPHLDKAHHEISKAKNDINKALAASRNGAGAKELERLRKLLGEARDTLKKAQDEIAALKTQLNQLDAQNKRLKTVDSDEQKQIKDTQDQVATLQKQVALETKQTLDRAEKNMRRADKAIQNDDVKELRRLLAQARADLAVARKELTALRQQLDQTEVALQKEQKTNAALQQQLDQTTAALDREKQKNLALQQKLDELKRQSAELSAELAQARSEIKKLNRQVDDLSSKLAEAEKIIQKQRQQILAQKQQIAQRDREIAYLRQHQGVAPPHPMVIISDWPCGGLNADVYVLSTYRKPDNGKTGSVSKSASFQSFVPATPFTSQTTAASNSPPPIVAKVASDDPFNPARKPLTLVKADDVVKSARPPTGAPGDTVRTAQWVLMHADGRKQVRLFYVLRAPLGILPATQVLRDCRIETEISYGDHVRVLTPVALSNAAPVVLAAIINLDGKFSIEEPKFPGLDQLSAQEKKAVAAWEASIQDALHPLAAAKAGRSKALLSSRLGWDIAAINANAGGQSQEKQVDNAKNVIGEDIGEINRILHPPKWNENAGINPFRECVLSRCVNTVTEASEARMRACELQCRRQMQSSRAVSPPPPRP